MDRKEMQKLFRATAAINTPDGMAAYKAFAAALTTPILQAVERESIMRQLFAVERLGPGAQAVYPVAEDFEIPVWILPGLGYVAQNFIEGIGEEVYVPTFTIDAAGDWKITYARDSRIDIPQRAAEKAAKAIADYEEESGCGVFFPAATSAFSGKGLLGSRPAPIYEINPASTGAGYLSKELINRMIVGFKRVGRTLTDLYVSPEDAADIREWTDTDIDPVTRREIFQAAGMGSIWNVTLREIQHLGATGLYNINGNASEYGKFIADGNDLYTGEIFPKESSPYQHPDTVRALYEAMKALESLERNRRRRKNLPDNAGTPWGEEEEHRLLTSYDAGISIAKLAEQHKRTQEAIRSRLVKLGRIQSS